MNPETLAIITTLAGSAAAIVAAYRSLSARIDAAVEARIGARLAPVLAAAEAADLPGRLRREAVICLLGPAGEARAKTETYLRCLGWRHIAAHQNDGSTESLAAIRGSDAVLMVEVPDEGGAAVAGFLGLPGSVASPTDAAYMPAIVWLVPFSQAGGRADMRPFGDACTAAQTRPQAAHWLEAGLSRRAWAKRALA